MLLKEEMRRVQEYAQWKSGWWTARVGLRTGISDELAEGIRAYAEEHADRELRRAGDLALAWGGLTVLADNVLAKKAIVETVEVELEEEEEENSPGFVD